MGLESISYRAPLLWSQVPEHLKHIDSVATFERQIKMWTGDNCSCRLCQNYVKQLGFILMLKLCGERDCPSGDLLENFRFLHKVWIIQAGFWVFSGWMASFFSRSDDSMSVNSYQFRQHVSQFISAILDIVRSE